MWPTHLFKRRSHASAPVSPEVRAFEVLLSRHRKPVFNFILRFVGDRETAEDLLQEAFMRVIKGAEAYKRDIPEAEIHLLDTGHFALETHASEIAARIRDFLSRKLR